MTSAIVTTGLVILQMNGSLYMSFTHILGTYAVIVLGCLSSTALFDHSSAGEYRLLNITIPESLNYVGAFDGTFGRYLDCAESVGVKTTGMGSMFRLSFRIRMKNRLEEKAFIDELRTLNGNLEIAVLPFPAQEVSL